MSDKKEIEKKAREKAMEICFVLQNREDWLDIIQAELLSFSSERVREAERLLNDARNERDEARESKSIIASQADSFIMDLNDKIKSLESTILSLGKALENIKKHQETIAGKMGEPLKIMKGAAWHIADKALSLPPVQEIMGRKKE